jgi:tetratricopeptide (TPR) repeat protein
MAAMPQGPRAGKLSASPDDKAFGGRVRLQPGDDSAFKSGQVKRSDEDDDAELYPQRRGSRVGMWIALFSLLVIGAAAGAVYMFVFNKKTPVAQPTAVSDAAVATAPADAGAIATATADAATEAPANPLEGAKSELLAGVGARIKTSLDGLAGKDDPASLAMRARLSTALAEAMQDRAGFLEKTEGDKLRKQAKQLVVDALPLAQRAFQGQQDSPSANLAMADVMRLQGKAAPSVRRYIDTARSKAAGDTEIVASVALSESQLLVRDGKLPDAEKALAGLDSTADMRIKLELALIAFTQNKPADAKAIVDQILATQPDHEVAQAMFAKLGTSVATTDPMPTEDGSGSAHGSGAGSGSATPTTNNNTGNTGNSGNTGTPSGGGGGDYDGLLAKANKLAETNCSKAMDLYQKALDLKSNGVEALTGMGYCHLDAKQFSSAFSKFRAALAVSSRYEPALGGIAETYQRQGNKEAAIEAWKNYLEIYPSSAKAKKQLEILGADSGGTGGTTTTPDKQPDKQPDSGSSTPPPTPTPAPTPAPAPTEGSASN